jgi:hypothetical protein
MDAALHALHILVLPSGSYSVESESRAKDGEHADR